MCFEEMVFSALALKKYIIFCSCVVEEEHVVEFATGDVDVGPITQEGVTITGVKGAIASQSENTSSQDVAEMTDLAIDM